MSSSSDDEDEQRTPPPKPCAQRLREAPIKRLLTYLRITNMVNALLLMLVFPLGFITEALTLQISTAFFTGYSIIFALILFVFECNCGSWQVRRARVARVREGGQAASDEWGDNVPCIG